MDNTTQFNYIHFSLEEYIDSLFDIYYIDDESVKNRRLIDVLADYTQLQSSNKWRWVFEDIAIIYFASILNSSSQELIELGYPHLQKVLFTSFRLTEDGPSEELAPGRRREESRHTEIKKYILLDLLRNSSEYISSIYDKYIDKCFPEQLIDMSTYDYRPLSQTSIQINNLFASLYSDMNSPLERLVQLVLAREISVYSMFIRLIDGLHNHNTFQTLLDLKVKKISTLFVSMDKLSSFKLFSKEWKSNSDFSILYNYNNLSILRISIPFYPINEGIQFYKRFPVRVNGLYESNMSIVPIDYILYQNNKLVDISQINSIYESYIVNKFVKSVNSRDIRFVLDQKIIHTSKMKDAMTNLYLLKYEKSENDIMIENFLRNILNETNIKTKKVDKYTPFVCIHESLLEDLNRVTTIKEYKLIMSKLINLTPDQICRVCSTILNLNIEDGVMSDEIEIFEEYYRLSDFIKFTRILIERIARIFEVYILVQNQNHRNYIIQILLEILSMSKANESLCLRIVEHNEDSLYFVFAPTNNLYIQDSSIDKFVYKKIFNINVIVIILMLCNYTINVKYEFSMYHDEYRKEFESSMKKIGIRNYNENVLTLFVYITVYILRYKLLYFDNIDMGRTLKDKIKMYGKRIFKCLMDHLIVLVRLGMVSVETTANVQSDRATSSGLKNEQTNTFQSEFPQAKRTRFPSPERAKETQKYVSISTKGFTNALIRRQSERIKQVLYSYKNILGNMNIFFTSQYSKYLKNMRFRENELFRVYRFSRQVVLRNQIRLLNLSWSLSFPNCHIYCPDSHVHELSNIKQMLLSDQLVCQRCHLNILKCKTSSQIIRKLNIYKAFVEKRDSSSLNEPNNGTSPEGAKSRSLYSGSGYISVYSAMNKYISKLLSSFRPVQNVSFNMSLKDLKYLDIFHKIVSMIGSNRSSTESVSLYTRIWLRRDILKIAIDKNNIHISTSSRTFTLYWVSGRLMNSEFPDINVHINLTRLGLLVFDKIKSTEMFLDEMRHIAIDCITSNLSKSYRTIGLLALSRLLNFQIDNMPQIRFNDSLENLIPIVTVNTEGLYTNCVLLNNYNEMFTILCIIVYILGEHFSSFYFKKINELIDSREKIFLKVENTDYLSRKGMFFRYTGQNLYPMNMFHAKPYTSL